ncbi:MULTISPECIES: protein DpdD [Microbacterium]|uniref:protein DpdD n=1 Tax=Microbacterium TaxID=33882 RepID=UPI00051A8242|nr:protein DpdD [Microbacterium profundi]
MNSISDDEFTTRFFSAPNTAWPGHDPNVQTAAILEPFLAALTRRGECPVILPRREETWTAACYYVICWDIAHAGRVRAMLDAATSNYWAPFDGRVARLNGEDPVDAAVLDLVGQGTTFVLRPEPRTAGPIYKAFARLVRSLDGVPLRSPTHPRPIGRMLREFDLALTSGAAETSAQLLQEIETVGGISHENVAFLQIRRMARLGRDAELLAHGSLPTLVYAEPPQLVREGILGAWMRVHLDRPIVERNIEDVFNRIRQANPDIAMLVDTRMARTLDPDAATLGGLVALARGDAGLTAAFASNRSIDEPVRRLLLQFGERNLPHVIETGHNSNVAESVTSLDVDVDLEPEAVIEAEPETEVDAELHVEADSAADGAQKIASWIDWARATGTGTPVMIEMDQARSWPAVSTIDSELAEVIDDLDWLATDDLLSGVAYFLEVDDIDRPAPRSAEALLRRYLLSDRYAPHDLGAICSLLEVFLRGAPGLARYREVLGDVRATSDQWVAIGTASRALDMADAVALGPTVDFAARSDFVTTLLSPLNQQKRRLHDAVRGLAGLVTSDVGLDFDWSVPNSKEEAGPDVVPAVTLRILLYSLDEGTLSRVQSAIKQTWPGASVRTSSDKDGSPMLKQHARNSELIIVATRRAAHAATGCIADNAGAALIRYPDGAGSASMLRAVAEGVAELTE